MDSNALLAIAAAVITGTALNACTNSMNSGAGTAAPTAGSVSAELMDASGGPKGRATVMPMADGLHVTASVQGMAAGTYAIHVHTTGACVAPDFASAGPHWNPTTRQHGTQNPAGPHKGDLPNITVTADGTGKVSSHVMDASLDGLLDADGAAIVVHAAADDYRTDPSGNSGGRIACGVLKRG